MITFGDSVYMLSMLNHKESYHIDIEGEDGLDLYIDRSMENNLRERNPQLGIVEGVSKENPYNLKIGDIVAVHHFSFYGDIGANKSFVLKPHAEWDGKKYFKILARDIFFKYNNKIPEMLGDYLLCKGVSEKETLGFNPNSGEFFRNKEFTQTGTILYGDSELPKDTEVLVLKNAFYLITLDKVDYFKVKKNEVVAIIKDGETLPTSRHMIIDYLPEKPHAFFDLSTAKKDNNCRAKVISIGNCYYKELIDGSLIDNIDYELKQFNIGDEIQVWRNQGVEYNGKRIIDTEMVVWRWIANADNELGIAV